MNYEEFFREASQRNVRLIATPDHEQESRVTLLSNEALFQLPFLAMVIMSISKGTRKPALSELGQLVGECLERTLVGFKGSAQDIGWSANLRIRTVKALTFLETCGLVEVGLRTKALTLTDKGRVVLERAMSDDTNLSNTLRTVERNYRNFSVESEISSRLL
jgi:hypothetical protein